MKTKYLLAALSLPLAFAACSDEFDELSSNVPVNQGGDLKITLNLTKDADLNSRATWSGSQLGWQESDMISMYWTGLADTTAATAGKLEGASNAIFKTTNGSAFTSESLVYLGKNAVVYPANDKHYAKGNIVIAVDTVQNAATVTKTPHISNLLNIQPYEIGANTPGYHQDVYAPMKLAANVVTLKLKMENTTALEKYGFEVESVQLKADKAFAKTSNLEVVDNFLKDTLETKGWYVKECGEDCAKTGAPHEADSIQTIVNSLWTSPATYSNTLTSTALTKDADGNYDVTFVVMPTDVETIADADIIIKTTCGTITLNTNDKVGNTQVLAHKIVNAAEKPTAEDSVTIAEGLKFFASSIKMPKTDLSAFDGEFVGRTIARSIIVDASKAELDGSEVKESADIIRYVNLYKDMQKKDKMNLVMVVDGATSAAEKAWTGLTKAAVDAIDAANAANATAKVAGRISLTSENVSEVQLSTVGAVYDVKSYNGNAVPLTLAAGAWSMNDTLKVNAKFSKVINKGTLTIAGTDKKNAQSTMKETIENQGTIALGGNNKVWMNGSFVNAAAGIINVAANQEMTFAEDIPSNKLCGTINVAASAMLTVADAAKVYNTGVINNSGIIAAEGTEGLYNAVCTAHLDKGTLTHESGIINILTANAITYVQNNAATINMYNRSNEVVVENNSGKIAYTYDYTNDGAEFEKKATDRFSYVVFGTDATAITLKDKNGSKSIDYSDISMEFKGSTTLTTNAKTIDDLVVVNGANLMVNSGNTLYVTNVINDGTITIGGNIYYNNEYKAEGRELSVGTGAITRNSAVAAAINSVAAAGGTYKLPSDATLSEYLSVASGKSMTLDLNGSVLTIDKSKLARSASQGGNGIENNGTLKIVNGKIIFSAETEYTNWDAGVYAYMTAAIKNTGTLTLENVEILSNVYTVMNYGLWKNSINATKDQTPTATCTIKGGKYVSTKDKNNDPEGPNAYSIMCVDNAKLIADGDALIEGEGGGLAVLWAFATLRDVTLTGNNAASTGAHDLYMLGGSVVTYTDDTTLTHNNKLLQDTNGNGTTDYTAEGSYGACSYEKETASL